MALLLLPGGCVRARPPLTLSQPRHFQRKLTTFATLSPTQGDSADWVEATSTFFENDTRPIMLFDGVCNLCNGGVKFVRDNDRNRRMRFEALQGEAGRKLQRRSGRAPDDISSVVLVEKDRSFIKSEAVLKIMEHIDLPSPSLHSSHSLYLYSGRLRALMELRPAWKGAQGGGDQSPLPETRRKRLVRTVRTSAPEKLSFKD